MSTSEARRVPVKAGLDILIEDPSPVRGRSWAMLCNQASVSSKLQPGRLALSRLIGKPGLLLAPEHGLDGIAQDMESVADTIDPLTGVPVRSLYMESAHSLAPRPSDLEGIDIVLVDLPDIGCRYYTFAASMDGLMRIARDCGTEVLILDRPNPLGGILREGGMVDRGFESFVSRLPVPVRHGLSLGEIALLLQRERYPELALGIIPCRGWKRQDLFPATGIPWVSPSPNMPHFETAVIYPGLCLIEATNLSEGRGTTRPFHLVGAPWIRSEAVLKALGKVDFPGVMLRPALFRPEFQKFAGELCAGIEIHVLEPEKIRALPLGLGILRLFHDLDPSAFSWRQEAYEFIADVPALDLLTGSKEARLAIEERKSFEPLLRRWKETVADFEKGLENILLYGEGNSSPT